MNKVTIPLEKGDKVIFASGATGKISMVDAESKRILVNLDRPYSDYEKAIGNSGQIVCSYSENDLRLFYLLGNNLIGNKVSVDILKQSIEETRKRVENSEKDVKAERAALVCLRRRLFQLTHNMNGEYNEKPINATETPTLNENNSDDK